MRVLQVIHGYPPRYNAGSEVYTQTLARALAVRHQVMVFSRFEDPYRPPYTELDETDDGCRDAGPIPVRMINMPHFRDRYRHERVDAAFARCLEEFAPDVVHIQHLNHLSTSLVTCAARHGTPSVFTLHDFWLQCPRGQFLQFFPEPEAATLGLCDGQEDSKCASHCYAPRYGSGEEGEWDKNVRHYAGWVGGRMRHVREIAALVHLFIAPSQQLGRRFVQEFGMPSERVAHLNYGFDLQRLHGRKRERQEHQDFVFGYIGTHVAAKGIHQLIEAFAQLDGNVRLRIWGRPHAEFTPPLQAMHRRLPTGVRSESHGKGSIPTTILSPGCSITWTPSWCRQSGWKTPRSSSMRRRRPGSRSSPPRQAVWRSSSGTRSTACSTSIEIPWRWPHRCPVWQVIRIGRLDWASVAISTAPMGMCRPHASTQPRSKGSMHGLCVLNQRRERT